MNKEINCLSLFDGLSCGRISLEKANINVANYFSSEIKDTALKVSNYNYPMDIFNRLGDVTKIDGTKLPKIDLLIGGSPCFVAGTKVITDEGYKNIEDVKVGNLVLTHTNQFRKVLKTGGQLSDTFFIEAQGIKTTETTKEHPYYVRSKAKVWNNLKRGYDWKFSEPKWVKAKDLKKYDLVGIPINNKAENLLNLTLEECYILGRYIADGHTNKHKRTKKGREHSRVYKLVLSVGKAKVNDTKLKIKENNYTYNIHSTSCSRFTFSNKRLVEIAEKYCGRGAINKVIPQIFINLPKELLSRVLEGYMDGDGYYTNGGFKGGSISQELIMSLSLVVGKIYNTNCSFSYFKRPPTCIIEGRVVNQQDSYSGSFRITKTKQGKSYTIDNIIWLPFKKSYEGNKQVQVYNLEVDIDNSYTANNAIVHNCKQLSGATSNRVGLEGKESNLFYEYLRLLKEVKPTYFLLENVRMARDQQDIISKELGVEPIVINSSLVSPQLRHRLYWTNIPDVSIPTNLDLKLNNFLINGYSERDKARALLESDSRPLATPIKMCHRYFNTGFTTLIFKDEQHYKDIKYHFDLYFKGKSAREIDELIVGMDLSLYDGVRYMNNIERESCQTVPRGYTDILTQNEAAGVLGDGWTCNVISSILKHLPNKFKKDAI